MSTSFEAIYEPFFYKIENDKDFFVYYNITSTEALALAKQRAKNILKEAITELILGLKNPDVNFSDYNNTTFVFNFDLTNDEINLIVQVMFKKFLERDVVKLKALKMRFTPSDLKVFSPANERATFMDMYEFVSYGLSVMIDHYNSRDRLTGNMKTINYDLYEY